MGPISTRQFHPNPSINLGQSNSYPRILGHWIKEYDDPDEERPVFAGRSPTHRDRPTTTHQKNVSLLVKRLRKEVEPLTIR